MYSLFLGDYWKLLNLSHFVVVVGFTRPLIAEFISTFVPTYNNYVKYSITSCNPLTLTQEH